MWHCLLGLLPSYSWYSEHEAGPRDPWIRTYLPHVCRAFYIHICRTHYLLRRTPLAVSRLKSPHVLRPLLHSPLIQVFEDAKRSIEWQKISTQILKGQKPDFSNVFRGYPSAVDAPASEYWPEILKQYPDVKVRSRRLRATPRTVKESKKSVVLIDSIHSKLVSFDLGRSSSLFVMRMPGGRAARTPSTTSSTAGLCTVSRDIARMSRRFGH